MWSLSDAAGRQTSVVSVVSVVPRVLDASDSDGECSYVDDDIDHDCFLFLQHLYIYIYRSVLIYIYIYTELI